MPTQATPTIEGRSVVELELRLPNNKVIPFDKLNVIHISSTISESLKNATRHNLVVRSATVDFVDSLVRFAQSKGTPKVRYRLGIGIPGQTVYLPWQEHVIVDFNAGLEGIGKTAGHFFRATLGDYLYTIMRHTKVAARRGKISDIVTQIAKENGLTNTVIEPTVGEGLWIQSYVDDVEFIRRRMVPRAINSKGRGNYNLYVQDNVLHFHTPDYQAPLKELVYYQGGNISLFQIDESQAKLEMGASGVRLIVYDPYTAQTREVGSNPDKALRLGNVMHQLTNVQGADLNVPYHLSTNAPSEAENMAQTMYENARAQILGIKLEITRSIYLRVGDILRIVIAPTSTNATPWSGTYLVTEAGYTIEQGASVAVFYIKRGEFQTSSTAPTSLSILGDTVLVNEQTAPGQPLNLKAAQSSGLTHGAGQNVFTSAFVTTQDKNAAPNPKPGF